MSADEIRRLSDKHESNGNVHCIGLKEEQEVRSALLDYAGMVERCEKRIEELGKCSAYEELHGGVCPACKGEEVTLRNCHDESCPNGEIIRELKALLRGDAGKEET